MKIATLLALLSASVIVQSCGNQASDLPSAVDQPVVSSAAPSAASSQTIPQDHSPKDKTAALGLEPEASDDQHLAGDQAKAAARLPDAPSPAPAAVPAPAQGVGKSDWGRNLVGSCRLYFSDDSVRCREIYGSSQARFIEIFIKHCQAGAGDYDGQWSESSCPLDLADKERVGGCLSEDPDYSTIAYSYIDPNDALAKGLVPLVRTQCLGTYIPER